MLERLILDVDKAMDAEVYLAALSLMLTLPDICAKAKYGNSLGNKKRYTRWYNEYIGQYEKSPQEKDDISMPYLSGEVIYQLRCNVLHQGTPNIDPEKIDEESCKIDHFTLITQSKNGFELYSDFASYDDYMKPVREYKVNIRRLWLVMRASVLAYYRDNKDKFNFFQCSIVEM